MSLYRLSGDEGDEIGFGFRDLKKIHLPKIKLPKINIGHNLVVKFALAPARIAFLGAVDLNLLKLATRLARLWKKPSGKADLIKLWNSFNGDVNELKKAIAKGSKQSISGEHLESVGILPAALAGAALPIIMKILDLFKKHDSGGDVEGTPAEKAAVDAGVQDAAQAAVDSPDAKFSSVKMPTGHDVALVRKAAAGGAGGGAAAAGCAASGDANSFLMVIFLFVTFYVIAEITLFVFPKVLNFFSSKIKINSNNQYHG